MPGAGGWQTVGPQRPGRTVSLRERLLLTRPVWLQLRASAAAALHVLRTEPPGVSLAPDPGTSRRRRGGGGGKAGHGGPEPPTPVPCRCSLCGNLTLAGARPCACGCPRPVAPPLSLATTSRRALGVSRTGLGGRGWKQSGPGTGVFSGEQPHFPSLRRLLGGLRTHVPRPGPAHLRLLPYPVSLAAGCLVSVGPRSLGHPVLPTSAGSVSPQCPEHPSPLAFCFSLWPQRHPPPPTAAPQSHLPGSHPQGTGSHLPSGHW